MRLLTYYTAFFVFFYIPVSIIPMLICFFKLIDEMLRFLNLGSFCLL